MLRRVARPVTVRVAADQARLASNIARLETELAAFGAANERLEERVARLAEDLEREAVYGRSVDYVLDSALLRDLPSGTRVCRRPAGSQRRAICSLATGPYRSMLSRSALSFERYAERWGWEVVLSTEDLSDGRPAPWGKVPLLRSLLDAYEWVLWLDADVVIVDQAADISTEIREGKDLYLTEHKWLDQYTANSGVMLIHASDWSRAFLDEVWAREEYADHPWWENAAVLDLLGYGLDPARLVRPTKWLRDTRVIDPRWNSVEIDRAERPAFIHRGFYDARTRTRQITGDLQCVLGDADPLTAGRDRPARPVTTIEHVYRREEIPLLLNSLGLLGTGIEVGVRKGDFSEWLLEIWTGERLISIDPWQADAPERYVDISNVTQDEHDWNYEETRRRLARFGGRSEIWRSTGEDAAPSFPPECLDFVYLDARHDEASVLADLECWWPRIRRGGIMSGHDYLDGVLPEGDFGVRSAVDAFFGRLALEVRATMDDEAWPSWIVVKP
jgi:hypothetical protein